MTISALACTGEPPADLVVEGSSRVLVQEIGRVSLPPIVTADGAPAEDLTFEVADGTVLEVDEFGLQAKRAGQSSVIVHANGSSATLLVVVDPPMRISFESPPTRMRVGDVGSLRVHGHRGNEQLDTGPLSWVSSHAEVISVDDSGTLLALAVGTAWITAEAHGGTAMIEIGVD